MSLKKEVSRFVVAGISAVGTDLGTYLIMINWFHESLAKTISFILGSVVAFLINKYWTFESKPLEIKEMMKFVTLYLSTLAVNVVVNQIVLLLFPIMIILGFFMATATSTILNFIGMKFWVFKKAMFNA